MFMDQEERLDYVVDNYIELFQRMLSDQGVAVFDSVFRQSRSCIIQDFRTVLTDFLDD